MLFGVIFGALKLAFLGQRFSRWAWLTLITAHTADSLVNMTAKVRNVNNLCLNIGEMPGLIPTPSLEAGLPGRYTNAFHCDKLSLAPFANDRPCLKIRRVEVKLRLCSN